MLFTDPSKVDKNIDISQGKIFHLRLFLFRKHPIRIIIYSSNTFSVFFFLRILESKHWLTFSSVIKFDFIPGGIECVLTTQNRNYMFYLSNDLKCVSLTYTRNQVCAMLGALRICDLMQLENWSISYAAHTVYVLHFAHLASIRWM